MKTSQSSRDSSLIDDFAGEDGLSRIGTPWRLVTDGVMGGVSTGSMKLELVDGRRALCLSGLVSLENNGGFVQINLDLAPRESFDASGFVGVRLLARGNGERYGVHLKTSDTGLPWQSYRAGFTAGPEWREERLPFAAFVPHRVESALDTRGLRRLGIVAIGKTMQADLCVAEVGFYRSRAVR